MVYSFNCIREKYSKTSWYFMIKIINDINNGLLGPILVKTTRDFSLALSKIEDTFVFKTLHIKG
ncbi:hypothetical protein CA834_07950 [Winogradskyella aurantia]|uniref:Uncharacterized protein n=1 Tax=Winogradskyella aurantia TaxID=1915063 RepID=A0A265UVN1_9FLAO|nr:hypothetical protein CA834_07950 [Winogradskyella aurantia]